MKNVVSIENFRQTLATFDYMLIDRNFVYMLIDRDSLPK